MRIRIADDDETLRSELAGILREDGHEVVAAADGGEALRAVERESFDVALLDLKMPKASGLDVLHRLRVVRPETAVVVVTGQGTIDAAVEAMKAGAIDFVEKPYEVEALQRTLRAVEEERRTRAMLGSMPADATISRILSDAASRGVLFAVIGPKASAPSGATRVLRIAEAGRPPDVCAPTQVYRLNASRIRFGAPSWDTSRPPVPSRTRRSSRRTSSTPRRSSRSTCRSSSSTDSLRRSTPATTQSRTRDSARGRWCAPFRSADIPP